MTKIAYFGTSDRSVKILGSLKSNFDLVLCVTKKDTQIGRHQETKETEVKKWAKTNLVNFVEISSLKDRDLQSVTAQLADLDIDLILVADFSYIIPETLINLYKDRMINMHFSLLPLYRGASPVQFALVNGDLITGITFHLVSKEMDKGDIISQFEYKIPHNITSGELYDEMFDYASTLIPEVIKEFYELKTISPTPQYESRATYTYSPTNPKSTFILKEDAKINWNEDVSRIERKVRAFNPWPIAYSTLSELSDNLHKLGLENLVLKPSINKILRIKLLKAKLNENDKLMIETVQVEGKNQMFWKEFVNGYLTEK